MSKRRKNRPSDSYKRNGKWCTPFHEPEEVDEENGVPESLTEDQTLELAAKYAARCSSKELKGRYELLAKAARDARFSPELERHFHLQTIQVRVISLLRPLVGITRSSLLSSFARERKGDVEAALERLLALGIVKERARRFPRLVSPIRKR